MWQSIVGFFFGPLSATHISKERNIKFWMDFVNFANILTDFYKEYKTWDSDC